MNIRNAMAGLAGCWGVAGAGARQIDQSLRTDRIRAISFSGSKTSSLWLRSRFATLKGTSSMG